MASYSTSEFKSGLKIMLGSEPFVIVENEIIKPGKGQAFNRVKVKNLKTTRVLEKTFKSGESVEAADVLEIEVSFLYEDGEFWHFMHPTTFEQYQTSKQVVANSYQWLKAEDIATIVLFNGNPISVMPANHVELEVVETEPGIKGDTVQGGSKSAILQTGAMVKVPLFIDVGDVLKIDSRTATYISRVK